ncbi:MAG: MFS transporter [Pirellulales bacterium]|nr:MFS transporter [Pirellulales bacterium]
MSSTTPTAAKPASRSDISGQFTRVPETLRPPEWEEPLPGVLSWSFLGLLTTQFLGAMNDNTFRWLAVWIGKDLVAGPNQETAKAAGLAMLVLPFLLLAAPAGYLADRFSKRTIMVGCKAAEVVIMALGVAAVLSGNIYLIFGVLFVMGSHSAIFGPSKYGSIPELVRADRISTANGLIGMTTIVAIVMGTLTAGFLHSATQPLGRENWWLTAAVLCGVAGLGLASSLLIARLPAANRARRFPLNWAGQTYRDLAALASHRPLLLAALGTTLFWSVAALCQVNVDLFADKHLHVEPKEVGPLLAVLALGVGLGNVLAGWWSAGKIELGLVPFGAFGVAGSCLLLSTVPEGSGAIRSTGYLMSCLWLFVFGLAAGLYTVPLLAFLQYRSPERSRGAILAASNFLSFSGTLAASGLFWLLSTPAAMPGWAIFLLAGCAMAPAVGVIGWLVFTPAVRVLVQLFVRTFYRVRVVGLENIPETGGALLVPNHVSWIDGVLLLLASPRPVRMVAYSDYIGGRLVGRLARDLGVIPIVPGRRSVVASIEAAREALRQGDLVCVFPEGQLTRTGQVETFRGGFLSMLKTTDAPVVPIYLGGLWGSIFSYERARFFWKWPRRLPYPVSIRIGRPIHQPGDPQQVQLAVQELGSESMRDLSDRRQLPTRAFLRGCRRNFRRPKLADSTGARLTGAELLVRTLVLRALLRRELLAGDEAYVGLLLPPSAAGAVANAAVSIDRRIAVNLNYTLPAEILNDCIRRCGIRHVLTSRTLIERLKLELEAEVVCLEDLVRKARRSDKLVAAIRAWLLPGSVLERVLGLHRVDPNEVLTVIFTSGSTGRPKGVMLTHRNVGANVDAFNQMMHLRTSDVFLGILPFFHSFGYTVTLWGNLTLDTQVVYHSNPLESRQIGALCREHGVTAILATPTFLRSYERRCQPEDFARLEVVITGAERLPSDVADAFERKFGVRPVEGYGATELSPAVAVNVPASRVETPAHALAKEGTVGRLLPGVAAKVVDPDTGENLGAERPGMLLVRGPNVMKGYLNEPERTAEVIRDGWYVTGDIAVIDADGFLRITGRQSRFSKIGGEMVPHLRIEEALGKLLRLDTDQPTFAVTGVPDAKKGERLVVLHTGLPMPPEQITRGLADAGLPPLWIPSPDSFHKVDKIPMLGSGKLDLRQVRQLAAERCSSGIASGPTPSGGP